MSGLPREVLKWLQSLDLTWKIKNPKWDLSNGFLIAEIFSWYFPQDIHLFSFYNRGSLEMKKRNWYILKNFILKNQIDVSMEDVDGTIYCKEGAAARLMESLYEYLTKKSLKKVTPEVQTDYTDYAYQAQLPMYQRSTLSKALKNNLRLPEILADQNMPTHSDMPNWFSDRTILKTQMLINDHLEHRRDERRTDPLRFGIKPTLGDRCVRRSPSSSMSSKPSFIRTATENPSELLFAEDTFSDQPLSREPSVHFKEIKVKQMNKSNVYQPSIPSH
ncbi:hypothetical protein BsWGS_17673 [Bradybaena similaris]